MIFTYGFSAAGSSHISKGTGCQDANKIEMAENGWIVAAVADGVGSCKYSDVASDIAVNTSVRICLDEIKNGGDNCDLLKVIEKAFAQAEREIDERSLSENHLITDYDTTLSLAIYDGKHITYGHSGDGGIVGLTNDGDYVKITTPQKKEGIYVIPLRSGKDTWIIDRANGEFASVLLATDGVYDIFFPYLLKGQNVEVYVPLIRYFMDNNIFKMSKETADAVGKERKDYINSDNCSSITDDKTIVVLVNGDVQPTVKDDGFYAEPDWESLQLEWNKKAYPHLYNKADSTNTNTDSPKDDAKDNAENTDNAVNTNAPPASTSNEEEKPKKKKWWGGKG